MIVGVCTITLHLIGITSLKDKRSVVKSVVARLRNEFNVSASEVDAQDSHARAVIGVACVSRASDHARGQLEAVVRWIEEQRPDVPVIDYEIELL
jgi:uncharacterized protein YlxP (DUF503 family)